MPLASADLSRREGVVLLSRSRRQWGAQGEAWAALALEKMGYKILVRNYRAPMGEIDLIVSQGQELVFVEVKLRRGQVFGRPQEAITRKKQRHLIQTAQYYLKQQRLEAVPYRFDIVAINLEGAEPRLEIITNAFGA